MSKDVSRSGSRRRGIKKMIAELTNTEFERLKAEYKKENDSYKKSLIFHVGTAAGFYSEVGSILEAMCYCHINGIKFILYADDANFSNNQGWKAFFEEFCDMNHDEINRTENLRCRKRGIKAAIKHCRVKKQLGVTYLTADLFQKIISPKLKATHIEWPLFNMNGTVYPEAGKLKQFVLRYNIVTKNDINKMIFKLCLPDNYSSVQIRGGDKITETKLTGAKETIDIIKKCGDYSKIKNMFVFTDDYTNIIELRKLCPEWNIFTLCRDTEKGYDNTEFNKVNWEYKRCELIKLFAMVEICIASDKHYAYEKSCANNIIRNCKSKEKYYAVVKTFY